MQSSSENISTRCLISKRIILPQIVSLLASLTIHNTTIKVYQELLVKSHLIMPFPKRTARASDLTNSTIEGIRSRNFKSLLFWSIPTNRSWKFHRQAPIWGPRMPNNSATVAAKMILLSYENCRVRIELLSWQIKSLKIQSIQVRGEF